MRVLIQSWRDVAHPLAGGSEEYVDRIAEGLAERGHDVTLVVARPAAQHTYRVATNGGRFTHYLRAPLRYLRGRPRPDVVVDVANGMTYYSPLWRRGPSVILVHHIHELQWRQWFAPLLAALGSFLERRVTPFAYRHCIFVTVSESTRDALVALGVDAARIRIVRNGVDVVDAEPAPPSPEPTFLILARLVPHKRVDMAVEAWREVQSETGGTLVIAGQGPEVDRIRALGVDRVELLGWVDEAQKQKLLGDCRFLVHPSELEGWGLVIMEAAAHGRPTLGFRVPGVRDSVVDGTTGLLADDFDEFVRLWIRMAQNPSLSAELGCAARARARELPWDRSVDAFEAVLEEAVRSGRVGGTTREDHEL